MTHHSPKFMSCQRAAGGRRRKANFALDLFVFSMDFFYEHSMSSKAPTSKRDLLKTLAQPNAAPNGSSDSPSKTKTPGVDPKPHNSNKMLRSGLVRIAAMFVANKVMRKVKRKS